MPALHSPNDSLASSLARLEPQQRAKILASLSEPEAEALQHEWRFWARQAQLAPVGDWTIWLLLAGRGFGKTRSVVGFASEEVEAGRAKRLGIAGATAADVRDVLVEGESGFLASSPPWNRPEYEPSKRRLTWPNGARAILLSADEPDRFRGPQYDLFIGDEIAAWRYPEALDQAMLGLRLGKHPRAALATTPRPTKIVREILAREGRDVAVTRGRTYDNRANLARAFLDQIVKKYEGTRLGRQELEGELLEDNPGALWQRPNIDDPRRQKHPELKRIVVAIDPAVTSTEESDETGIVVAGLGIDGELYVLDDLSGVYTPLDWAKTAVAAFGRFRADVIVAEVNNGGDLVEVNLRTVSRQAPYKKVHASRGKRTRAEPIAALYEKHLVHHVGSFPKLEDQMCDWNPSVDTKSPDRMDALVWCLTELSGLNLSTPRRRDLSNLW